MGDDDTQALGRIAEPGSGPFLPIAQAAPWPQLFSPETDRAIGRLCSTITVVIWFMIALAALGLVLLIVGVAATGQPPVK